MPVRPLLIGRRKWTVVAWLLGALTPLAAEDGYRLWLRYDRLADDAIRQDYARRLTVLSVTESTSAIVAARDELILGIGGLLDMPLRHANAAADNAVVLGTPTGSPEVRALGLEADLQTVGEEGYVVRAVERDGRRLVVVAANREIGVLYGAFALLRHLQTAQPLAGLDLVSTPKIKRRVLNHWDNLNGTVARGYAGGSLWDWFDLPYYRDPRYTDYARACASIGINGAVLTNVNADAHFLDGDYLEKVAVLADVFRPYGVRVYLAPRFTAPIDLGALKTADPLDPAVRAWWGAKADEIYRRVPDFGGFLVKANSEGQPGPQDYGRSHADGANMLAEALAPHGGVVMWRAFVYDQHVPDDRAKQAFREFVPLDGTFHSNVFVQIKNGAIDFMPREPFHPLFGAMPQTPLALEVQVAQEYLGSGAHLAFLAPMWKEVFDADTFTAGRGTTVARVIDGRVDEHADSAIAGVANTGNDRNWCGHPLGAANWYAFGRLAWDHTLSSTAIADEWTRMTFANEPRLVATITKLLLESRETVVNYSMPLGLHHIMAEGHHFGPGPWVDGIRPDWTSVYYHRADEQGLGFDRTATGSNAVGQYAPEIAQVFGDRATCPEMFLLWFHHVPWDHRMKSGRTLWDELCLRYQQGVDEVGAWVTAWSSLRGVIDSQRFEHVLALLRRQHDDARDWRDGCLLYFQTFSKRPLPAGVERPAHDLEYYQRLRHDVPGRSGA